MSKKVRGALVVITLVLVLLGIGIALGTRLDIKKGEAVVWNSSLIAAPAPQERLKLEATGMVKPVDDLRDYDGTYEGTPGTGIVGYSTLYRDNRDEGALSGCVGEGCGSHPGVDIPVVSGTRVYATLSGTIVRSDCNNERWGGLVTIRSPNPYESAGSVYFTFAHLRQRLVSAGQAVNTGELIGYSGGDISDPCRGNSTGAHLHFQVDKEVGGGEPYLAEEVNAGDANFAVNERTYNPIAFVTGGYKWTFEQPGFSELWEWSETHSPDVSYGSFLLRGGWGAYIQRGGANIKGERLQPYASAIAAEAGIYSRVGIHFYNGCVNTAGKLYFITSADPAWSEEKSQTYLCDAINCTIRVDMGQNRNWVGIITGLRVVPPISCHGNAEDVTYLDTITIER